MPPSIASLEEFVLDTDDDESEIYDGASAGEAIASTMADLCLRCGEELAAELIAGSSHRIDRLREGVHVAGYTWTMCAPAPLYVRYLRSLEASGPIEAIEATIKRIGRELLRSVEIEVLPAIHRDEDLLLWREEIQSRLASDLLPPPPPPNCDDEIL